MKASIQQPVLLQALKKGALPALSEDSQLDSSNIAILMQSIKVTVSAKCFSIESQNNMSTNRFSIVPTKENGVVVQDDGICLIKVKDLLSWVIIQGSESIIHISLDKLAIPVAVNTVDDETIDDKFAIKKIGTFKIFAKDNNKTGNKWELDAYDSEHLKLPSYDHKGKKQFSMNGGDFIKAVKKVSFACLKIDDDHVLDSISIQVNNGQCYFLGTNKVQCASYEPENIEGVCIDEPLLIPLQVLDANMKIMDPHDRISVYYNDSNNKVYFSQTNFDVRISVVDKDTRDKFSSVSILLSKKYEDLTQVPRKAFIKVLSSAGLVNKRAVLMDFNDQKKSLIVQALATFGKRPSISRIELNHIEKDGNFVCGAGDIAHALKGFKDDVICLTYCGIILRITSNDDVGFKYYSLTFNDPIYNDLRR